MNSEKIKKGLLISLTVINNIIFWILIGVSFFAVTPNYEENELADKPLLYNTHPDLSILTYICAISFLGSLITLCIYWIFNDGTKKIPILKILLSQWSFLMLSYLVVKVFVDL